MHIKPMQSSSSTEYFPFPSYHKRYYTKFAIPDSKHVPGNDLTLMFHSNGIALLTMAKTHIAHVLLRDPPLLSAYSGEIMRHIVVHCREGLNDLHLLDVFPFGYSIEWIWKCTNQQDSSKTLQAFFVYSADRKSSTHSFELTHLISVGNSSLACTNVENSNKRQKKSTIQAETGIGNCILTFYYGTQTESNSYAIHAHVQYTFPVIPCIPCEILEYNVMVLPDTPPSLLGMERALLPFQCPYDSGFLVVLNPSWKFREEILPELLSFANSSEDSIGRSIGKSTGLSKTYSTWFVVDRKVEGDFEVSNDLKSA